MRPFSYIPNTDSDRSRMLASLGLKSVCELFADIPETVRLERPYRLPAAADEWTLSKEMGRLADRNLNVDQAISFLGAGMYRHFIPSVVDAVTGRSEFYTSYTPYQPEISQGVLQAIFEYQSLMAALLGLDVSNASLYDGPTALGEAAMMACAHTGRGRILASRAVHPEYRAVASTYARGQGIDVIESKTADGATDFVALEEAVTDGVAAVVIQSPNFFGVIEDVARAAEIAHRKGALLIVATYPAALGVLEAPGVLGADIAVAEGQSLGNPLSFGGPSLGVIAATKALTRRLPGRIAGQTRDREGRRGFVLTLQAREQHIRREKASSNICSNQALNALAASVHLTALGPQGLREVGLQCMAKARYARETFSRAGARPLFDGPFFNEFAVSLGRDSERVVRALAQRRVFFGVPLRGAYPECPETRDAVLVAVTETNAREEIDRAAQELEREVLK